VPDLAVDRNSGVPIGVQLAWRLRSAIERGELKPGERLPSLRDAAHAAGVNVNTVRSVYAKLEAAGLVRTEQGRGTFVTAEHAASGEAAARRRLHDEMATLEAELAALPLLPSDRAADPGSGRARLLSLDELQAVRDVLAERVAEIRAARGEIVRRLESERAAADQPAAEPVAADPPVAERVAADRPAAEPVGTGRSAAGRKPSRRSSSSLVGARIRWNVA
jgi:DNA-binding transcriptional regulator YhcF (GntR family)